LQTHIFDGQNFYETAFYQFCDLSDKKLAAMVNDRTGRKLQADEKDGWMQKTHIEDIREVLRGQIAVSKGEAAPGDEHKRKREKKPPARPAATQPPQVSSGEDEVFETLEPSDSE